MSELHPKSKDFSKEDRLRIMKQFRESGLEVKEFAREHNMSEHTLKSWKWHSELSVGRRLQWTPTERKKIVEAFLSAQSAGMTKEEFAKVRANRYPPVSGKLSLQLETLGARF